MQRYCFKILLPLGLLILSTPLFAQFGGGGGGFGNFLGGGGGVGGGVQKLTLDTSDIYFFFAEEPNMVFPFSDSLLGSFQQYDPIRLQEMDYANLGNLGSPARPLFFQPNWRRGFDMGFHQFDIYQLSSADVRYYKITQAFTQAGYSQGSTQNDGYFNLLFSRNFAKGLNLSLETRRINNAGAFNYQKVQNSASTAGLWYHDENGAYDGYFSFVSNGMEQQNSGGSADTLLRGNLLPAYQVEMRLNTSTTRHANKELAYTQYFYLNNILSEEGKKRRAERKVSRLKKREEQRLARIEERNAVKGDSAAQGDLPKPVSPFDKYFNHPEGQEPTGQGLNQAKDAQDSTSVQPGKKRIAALPSAPIGQRTYTLYHQIAWRADSYKFSDTQPDSAFYGNFLVDSRGLRYFVETKKLENTFKLQTFKLKQGIKSNATGKALPRESDLLELGLVHSLLFVAQEPVDTGLIQNLFLTGHLKFSPNERLRIQSYGHLGIGANTGDFRLNGELFLSLKKIGSLRLEIVNQLYSPSLAPHRFFITQSEIWKNNFGKTLETSLSGTYSLPSFHFFVSGAYRLLNNLIYFDEEALPQQSGAFSIFQLTAGKDFQFGPFHSDNWLGLQQATSNVLSLPQFYSKHSLYFEKKIFKKVMLAKIGIDARLSSGYSPPAYQPVIGQFYLQEEQTLPFTPLLDAHLSFKVKTFRFFFKIENFLPGITRTYYYQVADYPLPYGLSNGGMRMGISWRLVD